ncbi:MAG: FAD-dependent pyridine nucleotide-disulfide oxidoreductase [Pseudonocardiales bacterium]|nr:FAD-dependent pyridine nucleotide-disulfide oxidoreductase [Pseudonocardiales bacterium]
MAKLRVVILGAGFGGLELATRLSLAAADDVEVTLIDRSDAFTFGFSKLDVMFGRSSADEVRVPYREIEKPSVTFRQELVTAIDPVAKRVVTDSGSYQADVLVVALGADLDPAATAGLVEAGHEFYSLDGATRLASVLPSFESGRVVIGVMGTPFKCPPAPSETALMLHDYLVRRGRREATEITVVSPLGVPVPPSPATSDAILGAFAERGITYLGGQTVAGLDPGRRTASLHGGGELDFDLFLGVPLHRAPRVIEASGLAEHGWVAVDPRTLATPFPDVYALGDVANAPVPRAGVFAETAARVVAEEIISGLRGGGQVRPYDGYGLCYIEFGTEQVARVEVTFITASGPRGGPFTPPSDAVAREKDEFAASRLQRWFGRAPAPV